MKRFAVLLIWYFAFGPEIYQFETRGQCDDLRKYMVGAAYPKKVSDCYEAQYPPNATVKQSTRGANSSNVYGTGNDVNITIDGKKQK